MTQMTQLKWKIVKWKVSEKLLKSQNFAILVKIFNLMLAMRLNGVHLGNLLRGIVLGADDFLVILEGKIRITPFFQGLIW